MKTFVFVSIFTWNYASDSIRVHVSVTIVKYNTLLRDLGKLLGEVVKWFWPSTLRKTITRRSAGGPTDLVWAPVMSGSRLLRVTDRKNGVAVIRKRSKKKILQNMLPDEFAITFYIIQLNWLWNTGGVRNRQGAGTISRGRFIVSQDVNTARKYP